MSDPKKDSKANDPSKSTVDKDGHPMIATPKSPEEKRNDDSMPENVKQTMLIKRPEGLGEPDKAEIGALADDDGEIITIGKGGEPVISEAVHKPGIDYLSEVAQDRRPLEGTQTRSIKNEHVGEQTRVIDRSSHGDDLGKGKIRAHDGANVHVGKPKKEADEQLEPELVEEIAEKVKKAGKLTETVNLPRGADAIKAIAKLAEEAKQAKKAVKAIEVPDESSDETQSSDE